MSDIKQIKAVARDRAGKGAARAVRRQGQVPAVIYGAGEPAQTISLDFNQTKQLIFAGHFLTTIFEIDVDGKTVRAIPRDYQLDPVRDFPVHVDFLRLAQGQAIKVVVPVHVAGQEKIQVPADTTVTATVGIGPRSEGGFGLDIGLDVSLPGMDRAQAEQLVEKAHQVCPYSNATRNNVPVRLRVV